MQQAKQVKATRTNLLLSKAQPKNALINPQPTPRKMETIVSIARASLSDKRAQLTIFKHSFLHNFFKQFFQAIFLLKL
jgi:hypothetical protein